MEKSGDQGVASVAWAFLYLEWKPVAILVAVEGGD